MASRYSLKLKTLKFISAVDVPAQETATAVLFKTKDAPATITANAKVVKLADELGLVFGWALTSKASGSDYFDLHGDNVLEDDLIKVAAEYLAAGGATDEMHDHEADGKVVFAMPLTAEVAKAFGIETTTTGLMIAIKPSAEVFAKFKSKELTGFSIDGTGIRTELPTSTVKRAALTTAILGHTHILHGIDDMQSGCTSGERMPRPDGFPSVDYYDGWHSHNWIRLEDGSVVVGESMNHTHEISTTSGVAKAKDDGKSSPSNEVGKVSDMKPIVLTESQFAHYQSLVESDRESFVGKSFADREADVAKAASADIVVFTGELTKAVVRKSHGELALKFAQQSEAQAVELAKAKLDIAAANDARESVELTKRATDTIGNLAGTTAVHCAVLKAVESIADATVKAAALETLKAANAAMAGAQKAKGFGGANDPTPVDGLAAWNADVKKFATDNDIKDLGLAAERFLGTDEGRVSKRAYDKSLMRAAQ